MRLLPDGEILPKEKASTTKKLLLWCLLRDMQTSQVCPIKSQRTLWSFHHWVPLRNIIYYRNQQPNEENKQLNACFSPTEKWCIHYNKPKKKEHNWMEESIVDSILINIDKPSRNNSLCDWRELLSNEWSII
jgi:hypothetical protein